jgi:hypothetical protein
MMVRRPNSRRQAKRSDRFAWLDIFRDGSMAETYLHISTASESELQETVEKPACHVAVNPFT